MKGKYLRNHFGSDAIYYTANYKHLNVKKWKECNYVILPPIPSLNHSGEEGSILKYKTHSWVGVFQISTGCWNIELHFRNPYYLRGKFVYLVIFVSTKI